MAIKEKPQYRIYKFYKYHKNMCIAIVVLFQLIATGIFGGALLTVSMLTIEDVSFWELLAIAFLASLSVNLIAMSIIIEPMRAVSAAIAHAIDENSPLPPPPSPNANIYARNGTKEMLDVIYGLGAATLPVPTKPEDTSSAKSIEADHTTSLLDDALRHSASSVIIFNQNHDIVYASKHAPVKSDTHNKHKLDLMFDSSDQSLEEWVKSCAKSSVNAEKMWTRVRTNPDSSSERRIYDVAASYSRASDSELVLVLQDHTADYEPDENDLDFIAFAAHELRGPITVIRGYLDVFEDELDDKLDDEQKVLLGRLIVSANRLSTYINNILNVSRYDRKHYKVELTKQRLFDIYDSIVEDMQSRAKTQNRLLTVDISHDLPPVAADATSIAEVMSNLIDNAIKYSNEGGIINVSARVSGDFVEVSVADNGIGMPDGVVRNLFHKFYRSHRSREAVAGSGIGLYLSKAIVESHGGTISVTSSEDHGSTFTFSLPIYSTVEKKLKKGDNGNNEAVINRNKNWISNHNMYRG